MAQTFFPPSPVRADKPSVILYGSIERGTTDWRVDLASSLSSMPIIILNPDRKDWDSTWVEDIVCAKFKEQVEWEMDHAKLADVIAFHFGPSTDAPVTLLELGMYAASGKVVVHCDPGYRRKGNVQIVCERYGIPLAYEMEDLVREVKGRLQDLLIERE